MLSLVTNLNSSTAQEIVNCVTTADGCVHTADTTQLDFAVSKFVQTRRGSTGESRRLLRCVLNQPSMPLSARNVFRGPLRLPPPLWR